MTKVREVVEEVEIRTTSNINREIVRHDGIVTKLDIKIK